MAWHDLLFLHWRMPPDLVGITFPRGVHLDTHGGDAWVSLVAFHMSGVRLRNGFAVPGATRFPELNLRTYVKVDGRPCVWFLSLDAGSRAMVELLRRWYSLPYLHAEARVIPGSDSQDSIQYRFQRADRRGAPAALAATAWPRSDAAAAESGTLDDFLAERYRLATIDRRGRLRVGHVRHGSYPLQSVEVEIAGNTCLDRWPRLRPDTPDHTAFARRLDVVAWTLESPGSWNETLG